MRKLATNIIVLLSIVCSTNLFGQLNLHVKGYYKSNGTYVQPHYKTAPNSSMFDNFSTKGNINPYTGKPGWIDPYSKVSSSYYGSIRNNYRPNYNELIDYLNKKDSVNYFKIVNSFDYQTKLFFTGIFNVNNNKSEEANRIFDILRKDNSAGSFISKESNYWFDITSMYLAADEEFVNLYKSSEKYDKDGNYQALQYQLDNVRNPLNFYDKYLIKFTTDLHRHKYLDAKNSLDSLIVYSSESDLQSSLIVNYNGIVANLVNMQNTLDTRQNGTYYYKIEDLISNLGGFVINDKIPIEKLSIACFKISTDESTSEDTTFLRTLNDTSDYESGVLKLDYLNFHVDISQEYGLTTLIISLRFIDDASYLLYKNQLSHFAKYQSSNKSAVYNFTDPEEKEEGFEYLINNRLIGGLTEEKIDDSISKNQTKMYRIYFYCVKNSSGNLVDLSVLFN